MAAVAEPLDNDTLDAIVRGWHGGDDGNPAPLKRAAHAQTYDEDDEDDEDDFIGVKRGQSSFTVQEPDFGKLRRAPIPAEDGRWPVDPNTRRENDARRFGPEWRTQMESRRDLLERDPNYVFLTLVAGAANTDVESMYVEDSLGQLDKQRLRRFQQRRAIEAAVSSEADMSAQATSLRRRVMSFESRGESTRFIQNTDDVLTALPGHEDAVRTYVAASSRRIGLAAFLRLVAKRASVVFNPDDSISEIEEAWTALRDTGQAQPHVELAKFLRVVTAGAQVEVADLPFPTVVRRREPGRAAEELGQRVAFVDDEEVELDQVQNWVRVGAWTDDATERADALLRWMWWLYLDMYSDVADELTAALGRWAAQATVTAVQELARSFDALRSPGRPLDALTSGLVVAYAEDAVALYGMLESGFSVQEAKSWFSVDPPPVQEDPAISTDDGSESMMKPAVVSGVRNAELTLSVTVLRNQLAILDTEGSELAPEVAAAAVAAIKRELQGLLLGPRHEQILGIEPRQQVVFSPSKEAWRSVMADYELQASRSAFSDADFPTTAADRLALRRGQSRDDIEWSSSARAPPTFGRKIGLIHAQIQPVWLTLVEKLSTTRDPAAYSTDEKLLYRHMSGSAVFPASAHTFIAPELGLLVTDAYIFGGRLFGAAVALRLQYINERLAANQKQLDIVTERLAALQSGAPVLVQAPDVPYEHRRGWVEAPENSGVVHIKPIVQHAIELAWTLVKRFTPFGAHHEVDEEFMQHDPAARADFAMLVAIKMAMAGQRFPKQYLQMKLRELNDRDERNTMRRLTTAYQLSQDEFGKPVAKLINYTDSRQLFR